MNKSPLVSIFILVLIWLVAGCGKTGQGKVIARVGSETVTEEEFKQKFDSLPKALQSVALANKKKFVEEIAAERFLLKEAERRRLSELSDVKGLLEAARKKILVAKLVEAEVDQKIRLEPDEVWRYYESHKDDFMTPSLIRASHILVKTQEEADEIKGQLAGGADFEDLARKKSLDPTGIRGGDLGFFQKGQFVSEFEEAAFALKKGEVSGVVKTRFGYHLIKLTDKMEPTLRDFSSVKGLIEEKLTREKRSAAFKALVERLEGGAPVKVDDKILESLPAAPGSGKSA